MTTIPLTDAQAEIMRIILYSAKTLNVAIIFEQYKSRSVRNHLRYLEDMGFVSFDGRTYYVTADGFRVWHNLWEVMEPAANYPNAGHPLVQTTDCPFAARCQLRRIGGAA